MKDMYGGAAGMVEEVWQFAQDHPVFVTVVALGVLVRTPPPDIIA